MPLENNITPNISAFEKNRERGAEIRQAITNRISNLFKRFGRGVDAGIGATASGIDAGIGATVDSAIYVRDRAIETKDAVVETAVAGKEFVIEKAVQTREAVVETVNNTVDGTRKLIDSGVAITKEKYEGARSGIIEAKNSVFSYIEKKKKAWEQARIKAEYNRTFADIQKVTEKRNTLLAEASVQQRRLNSLKNLALQLSSQLSPQN